MKQVQGQASKWNQWSRISKAHGHAQAYLRPVSRMEAWASTQLPSKGQEVPMRLPMAPSHTALSPAAWSKATAAPFRSWNGARAAKPQGGGKRLQSLLVRSEPWQQHAYFQISIQSRRYQSLKSHLVRDEAQLFRAGMFTAAWWKSAKPYAIWSSAPWLFTNSVSRGPVGWAVPESLTNTRPSAGPRGALPAP